MFYVTTHYDVINYIYQRRKRHFEVIVDTCSYKVINDGIIICIDIIQFSFIFFEINFNYLASI